MNECFNVPCLSIRYFFTSFSLITLVHFSLSHCLCHTSLSLSLSFLISRCLAFLIFPFFPSLKEKDDPTDDVIHSRVIVLSPLFSPSLSLSLTLRSLRLFLFQNLSFFQTTFFKPSPRNLLHCSTQMRSNKKGKR